MSLSTYYLEYGRHVARLRRRRRRAFASTSNTASHDTHEKINSRVYFYSSLIWVRGSAWRPSAAGAPLTITIVIMIMIDNDNDDDDDDDNNNNKGTVFQGLFLGLYAF